MNKTPKLLLTHYYTKRCTYGNVYHVVNVQNLRTGKSFNVDTPSLSNVTSILYDAFGGWENMPYIVSEVCTGSARTSSLPEGLHLDPCRYDAGKLAGPYKVSWKKELNKIGFRFPKQQKAA